MTRARQGTNLKSLARARNLMENASPFAPVHVKYRSLKKQYASLKEPRDRLVESVRRRLLPLLIEQGFAVAPLVRRGPVDREVVLSLPFGRLCRHREAGVDLVQIEVARYRRAAFRIMAGVAPQEGLMTFTGHWAAEDVFVDWLDEYFVMYACPWLRIWFSVWHWPHRSPVQADYEKLALRVARFVPEIELVLRDGRLGPHMRRVVIPRHVPRNM